MSRLALTAAAGATGAVEEVDEFFENTVLLLHGDGTNGAQNNTFLDSSTNNFTITRNGNTTQGSFSPFSKPEGKFGNFFDGSGDYLSLTLSDSNIGIIGVRDGTTQFVWTIECWIYPTSSDFNIVQRASNAVGQLEWYWYHDNTNGISWHHRSYGSSDRFAYSNVVLPLNQWHHVVQQKEDNSTWVFYINGVKATTSYGAFGTPNAYGDVSLANSSGVVFGGSTTNPSSAYHMSNFRFTQKIRYSGSTIAVPTSPFSADTGTSFLSCQSNRFKDNSTNNFAITRNGDVKVTPFSPFPLTTAYDTAVNGGSGYFDGTGDYLSAPNNAAWNFGTGDFTIEGWFYIPSTSVNDYQLFACNNGSGNNPKYVAFTQSGEIIFDVFFSGLISLQTSGSAATSLANQFAHIAVVKNSSVTKIYINGVEKASGADTKNYTGLTQPFYVGYLGEVFKNNYLGYISSFRVISGTAVYTAAFTPPTAPLTTIANTELLLNFTNAGIFDNTAFNNLETVADAQIDTSVKKYGTGSIEFDGSGDWLAIPDSPDNKLESGNCTIECWVYPTTSGTVRGIISKGSATTGWSIQANATQRVFFSNASSNIFTTANLTSNAWNNIAVVREGLGSNQLKIYINGLNVGTGTANHNFNQTDVLYIGANRTATGAFSGYIDEVRITKGVARYTANFTPQVKKFPDIGD